MIRPEDVTDAMVNAAFGDLLDGTGNANWASRPNREIMRGALARAINAMPPIPMILHCPACGLQHIDKADPDDHAHAAPDGSESRWTNPPHRSHLCHGCGHIWRPADVCTVGVERIETKGRNDSPAVIASGCVLVKLDDGKLWSFLRSVLSQGGCIWADYQKSSSELYSARLDAAAAERATELRAMLAAADPREQALDRMAENAQELGLYDEGKEKGDE